MTNTEITYSAITIVSPSVYGEGKKDQDRARTNGPCQVSCVCDGVTTSPRSELSAEISTQFAPILFDDKENNIRVLCDLLMANRKEYQQSEVDLPADQPSLMQEMLKKIIKEKRASSFQTTIIAIKIDCSGKKVTTDIIKCGDSAFFAFSAAGEPLSSSLINASDNHQLNHNNDKNTSSFKRTRFGPGNQVLVRVDGLLSNYKNLAQRMQKQNRDINLDNWIVCTPIEICSNERLSINEKSKELPGLILTPQCRLLVPRYLHGTKILSKGHQYYVLDYSSTIRILSLQGALHGRISQKSAATLVLPDHFYDGLVESYQDYFPLGTNFVLCSDGFYNCFSVAGDMWQWLTKHSRALSDTEEKKLVLQRLHNQLDKKCGDDDISFIWTFPSK